MRNSFTVSLGKAFMNSFEKESNGSVFFWNQGLFVKELFEFGYEIVPINLDEIKEDLR